MYQRLLLLAVLLCSLAAHAAAPPPLSERSALQPGLWWDSRQPGQGFDLQLSGRNLGLIWYSFRADGSPVWYLASGPLDGNDSLRADLLEARWGAQGLTTTAVGEIRISRRHAESARLEWRLGTASGSWLIEPFRLSPLRLEFDPSGAYHEPARDGFGVSLDLQGEQLSAIYYVYDSAGQPTWWLGSGAQGSRLDLKRYRGPCPGCPLSELNETASISTAIGVAGQTLNLSFTDPQGLLQPEFRLLSRPLRLFTPPALARQADYRLAYFDQPDELKRFLQAAMLEPSLWQSPTSGVDFSPAPPSTALGVSSTNLIEAGVDEADLIKSDGSIVVTFETRSSGQLRPALRLDRLDRAGPGLSPLGRIELLDEAERSLDKRGLYLDAGHLVSLSSSFTSDYTFIELCPPPPYLWLNGQTRIEVFDRPASGLPQRRWSAQLDGELVTSRRIGDSLLLVQRHTSGIAGFRYGATDSATAAQNRALLEQTPLTDLLPRIRIDGGAALPLVQASKVLLPPAAALTPQPDFAVVTRINLRDPSQRESLAVVGGVAAIHVSTQALYFTTTRFDYAVVGNAFGPPAYGETDIHKIDFSGERLEASASGTVAGMVDSSPLAQPFRLSEFQGRLRIITHGEFGAAGVNRLSILEPSQLVPGLLKRVSELPNAARPQPIGKPGERLYASRFVGERLYAVTFQQIDPLYSIDLANPLDPRIAGELQIPGFSEYLHPVGSTLLLGVGQHANDAGVISGLKVALFDVSGSGQPRLLAEQRIGQTGSYSALFDSHHAFSALPLADGRLRFTLPITVHGQPFPDAAAAHITAFQPWTHSGVYAFDIAGEAASGRLSLLGASTPLGPTQLSSLSRYDVRGSARSLLTESGLIYLNGGRYWTARWGQLDSTIGPR